MNDTRPISKRSRRILEETQRHLRFADRGINQLAIAEYYRLSCIVSDLYPLVDLATLLQSTRQLEHVLRQSLAQRS